MAYHRAVYFALCYFSITSTTDYADDTTIIIVKTKEKDTLETLVRDAMSKVIKLVGNK